MQHSAHFRRLWLGITVGQLGQQMTAVAVAYQVWVLTNSSFAVGMVGAAAVVPLIVFGLYGGALVDALDRRMVAILASVVLWLLSVILVAQAAIGLDQVWLLYVVAGGQSACFAVNNPARQAIVPRLLPPRMLPSANALSTLSFNLGLSVGPLAGGALIAVSGGFVLPYAIDTVTFLAALYALWRLPPIPPQRAVRRAGLQSMVEGFRFLRERTNVLMTFLVDLCAMVVAQPRALFPEPADTVYGGGARTVGILQAAPAIGAVGCDLQRMAGQDSPAGMVILICVVAYGASVAAFGLAGSLWLGVVFLAHSGAFDMISAAYRSTILQVAAPDEMRGRLQGVFVVVVAGGPRLGEAVAGSVGSIIGPTLAVVTGGCAYMVAIGLLATRIRGLPAMTPAPPGEAPSGAGQAAQDLVELAVDAVEAGVDAVEAGVDAVEAGVDAVEPGVHALEAGVDAVEPGVHTLESGVDGRQLVGLATLRRLDPHEHLVDRLDIVVQLPHLPLEVGSGNRHRRPPFDQPWHCAATGTAYWRTTFRRSAHPQLRLVITE
ncbi:MAG: MFS transporter [Jiangellaceae bacterium]